ncbi:MAG TPA: diguanylate cyclase, partial [Planctomycetota bacterium]
MATFQVPDDPLFKDPITGLPNRRALLHALRERVIEGRGALVLIDIDHWRKIRERMVPAQVDRMLSEVGRRLKEAGAGDGLFRYALDAFALLVPDADREGGGAAARRLCEALARSPVGIGAEKGSTMAAVRVTASAGVAAYPLDGRSPTALIETVEIAVMVAKQTGRNRVAVSGELDPAALAEIGVFRGLPCPVIVGRVEEQTRLRQLASDVRHVGPRLALITSEPGFGKTRLLRELALWGRTERFVVMSAVGQEHRFGLPYGLLVEMVENLLATDRALAVEAIAKLSVESRAALSVMVRDFPGAAELSGVVIPEFGKGAFAAWGGLLDELAKTGPLFLALDEVEYADEGSLEVLGAAMDRRVPMFFVSATAKPPTALGETPAGQFFRARVQALARVSLQPLPPEEMEKVLRSILPDSKVSEEATSRLVRAAKGNPLHLEETIRALLLKGKVRLVDGVWTIPSLEGTDLPQDLDAAVKAVSDALPARSNSLLARAAVIGLQVDPDLLQEVMGQDENEMLDLIDEARRARLLSSPEWGSEMLTFPAAHARRVRLEAAEAGERKEIHARVGVVQEARHGGNTSHIAGELAFHYGRAGQDARARHFEGVARRRATLLEPPKKAPPRRARLDLIKDPLSPESLVHANNLMRWFGAALRIGRLYPKRSQVSDTFQAQLKQAVATLLGAGPGVTFTVTADGLTINGVETDLPSAVDFAPLLQDRLIESLTLAKGFDPERLRDLLEAFGETFNAVAAKADHWDQFLTEKAVAGLDILQKAYQSTDRGGVGIVRGEEAVPPAEIPRLLTALRALKTATENVKLYPPGHSLVEETTEQAMAAWMDFLGRVPAVTLGVAEGDLVVNGQPADRKFFGDAGAFMVKEIEQRGVWSLSLGRGMSGDELRSLI